MKKITQIAGMAGVVIICLGGLVGLIQHRLSPWVIGHLVVGLALLVMGGLANAPEIRETLARRSVRMGPQVLLQGLLILIILIFFNLLVLRHDYIKDLTRVNLYTLSRLTEQVATNLPGEVELIAFFPGGGPHEARQRLQLYASKFDLIRLRQVDPDKNEDVARAEGVPPQPGVLFKFEDERVWITKYEENDITNALIKVTRTTKPRVWFTTAHGEPGLDSQGPNGLLYLRQMLEQQGYIPEAVDLSTIDKIPKDVSMVALVGPSMALTPGEVALLDYYLGQGGNAIIFLDPVAERGAITGLESFIEPYGIRAKWNLVFDPDNHLAGDRVGLWIVATDLRSHPITGGLTQPRTVFYMSRSFEAKEDTPESIGLSALIMTSPGSYDKSIDPMMLSTFSSEEERNRYLNQIMTGGPDKSSAKGPFALAYAIEKSYKPPAWKRSQGLDQSREMRLVVIGSSKTCRNNSIYMPYNYELVMNAMNWLAGEKDLKTIRSPRRPGTRLYLDEKQKDRILYTSVMILPEIFMIIGLAVWWRRR